MNMVKTSRCNVTSVTSLIKKYVPDAGLESNAGAELSYVLPHESSYRCVTFPMTADDESAHTPESKLIPNTRYSKKLDSVVKSSR